MVDDSMYVIVGNRADRYTETKDGEIPGALASNGGGDILSAKIREGWQIISKVSCRDAIHYVIIKPRGWPRPEQGSRIEPNDVSANGEKSSEVDCSMNHENILQYTER